MEKNLGLELCLKHRVSYGETDMMGVVYYAEYLHIFERARSEFIRLRGMSYNEVEAKDIILPVREANCRYKVPAHFDELLLVYADITVWGRASLTFAYEIWDETHTRLLCTGTTEHACVSAQKAKPVAVPLWLKELFTRI